MANVKAGSRRGRSAATADARRARPPLLQRRLHRFRAVRGPPSGRSDLRGRVGHVDRDASWWARATSWPGSSWRSRWRRSARPKRGPGRMTGSGRGCGRSARSCSSRPAVAWAGGGAARAIVTHHHGHVGTAQALALIGVFIGLLACFRRWGTGGARGHVAVHDAQDAAILSEAVRRDGRGQGTGRDGAGGRRRTRPRARRRVPARPLDDRRAAALESAGALGREPRLGDLHQLEAAGVDPEPAARAAPAAWAGAGRVTPSSEPSIVTSGCSSSPARARRTPTDQWPSCLSASIRPATIACRLGTGPWKRSLSARVGSSITSASSTSRIFICSAVRSSAASSGSCVQRRDDAGQAPGTPAAASGASPSRSLRARGRARTAPRRRRAASSCAPSEADRRSSRGHPRRARSRPAPATRSRSRAGMNSGSRLSRPAPSSAATSTVSGSVSDRGRPARAGPARRRAPPPPRPAAAGRERPARPGRCR